MSHQTNKVASELASEAGVTAHTVRRWCQEFLAGRPFPGGMPVVAVRRRGRRNYIITVEVDAAPATEGGADA